MSQTEVPIARSPGDLLMKLKVEEALSYLDLVKYKFRNQPEVYADFLAIMHAFKDERIDIAGVAQRISNLFRGHPYLWISFSQFLPPSYRREFQDEWKRYMHATYFNGAATSVAPCSIRLSTEQPPTAAAVQPAQRSPSDHLSRAEPLLSFEGLFRMEPVVSPSSSASYPTDSSYWNHSSSEASSPCTGFHEIEPSGVPTTETFYRTESSRYDHSSRGNPTISFPALFDSESYQF